MELLVDPRKYITTYFQINKIEVNERGEIIHSSGKNLIELFDTLWLDYCSQVRAYNANERTRPAEERNVIAPIQEKNMLKAINETITEKKIVHRKEVIELLKCEKEDLTGVKKYVQAVTGNDDNIDFLVFCHFLWQIKRKMMGRKVYNHTMPILFGKQDGGKTEAMNRLTAPVNAFRLNINIDQMTDERFFKAMSENYIIVFDEMSGAERTDINALKKQITIEENDYKPLYTNQVLKVKQSCTFIGATNKPIAEQIVDSTGMRRFYEIKCQDILDWEAINSLDYLAIWKGIDENKEFGYLKEILNSVREKQKDLIAKEELDVFIQDLCIKAGEGRQIPVNYLYNVYSSWSKDHGFKPMNIVWFGRKMGTRGIESKVIRTSQGSIRAYCLSIELQLPTDNMVGRIDVLEILQ